MNEENKQQVEVIPGPELPDADVTAEVKRRIKARGTTSRHKRVALLKGITVPEAALKGAIDSQLAGNLPGGLHETVYDEVKRDLEVWREWHHPKAFRRRFKLACVGVFLAVVNAALRILTGWQTRLLDASAIVLPDSNLRYRP